MRDKDDILKAFFLLQGMLLQQRGETNSSAPMVEGMVVVWSPGRAGDADLQPSNNRYEPIPVLSTVVQSPYL